MKIWMRFLVLLTVAALFPALATACGGGGKKGDDRDATPTRAASTAADDTPEGDASPTRRASLKTKTPVKKTATSAKTSPATSAIDLDSFHYEVEIAFNVAGEDVAISGRIEGDYVAPDAHSYTQEFSFAGISGSEAAVIIGGEAWRREGESDWEEVDPSDLNTDLTSADPEFIADSEFVEDIDVFDSEEDQVDGRAARKYSFTKEDIDAIAGLLGDDFIDENDLGDIDAFTMVVWIDEEEEVILRADLSATAKAAALGDTGLGVDPDQLVEVTLTLRLSNVNDGSIEIEPPI
ncbi:MAG TPA: hypothetical protein VJP07_00725 [Dehalococcoidia bacterium]|nr:hypothetical protein [Dehalococcoidia bacterium]